MSINVEKNALNFGSVLGICCVVLIYWFSFPLFVAITATVLSLLVSIWVYDDIFSPMSLLGISWFGALAVYELHLMAPSIQPDLTLQTYYIIYASALLFFVGCYFANRVTGVVRRASSIRVPWSEERTIVVLGVYMAIGGVVFAYMFQNVGGINAFLRDSNSYRHNLFVPVIYNLFLYPVTAVGIISFVLFLDKPRRLYLLLTVLSFVFLSLRLARMAPLFFLLILVVCYSQMKRIRLSQAVAFGGFTVLIFSIIGSIRSGFGVGSALLEANNIRVPFDNSLLATLYVYIAPGFRNIQIITNRVSDFTYGTQLSYGLYSFFPPMKSLLGEQRGFEQEFYGSFGVFPTYITDFYLDFGIMGILVGCLTLGFISTYIYNRLRQSGEIGYLFVYAAIGASLLLSFVSNRFSHPSFWRILFIVLFTHYIILNEESDFRVV
ncbi:oligosaccharide repeat unit polymerase [Haloarcula sp. CBA1130]|nr:oligosaccharide repeat unit polymerase [Haloarcula sp. CBA1129]KAA9402047.1 oligosaccharide repeat unit polymerase [Haloarcula sp. CBA1130]